MLQSFIRWGGVILIIGFSAFSVFVHKSARYYGIEGFDYAGLIENQFYDFRMRKTFNNEHKEKRVVLAAIDDKSLESLGRWPWSRSQWIPLMHKMKNFGAKVVAFDVVFSEKQEVCNAVSPDLAFANSIADFQSEGNRHVILPYAFERVPKGYSNEEAISSDSDAAKELPVELYNVLINSKKQQNEAYSLWPCLINKTSIPLQVLRDQGVALGYIGAHPDKDGIFRHYPLAIHSALDELELPSQSLLAYTLLTGEEIELNIDSEGILLKTSKGKVNLNQFGEVKIRWEGDTSIFPTVSVLDIIEANDNDPEMKEVFNDTVVFIGSTAFGAHDLRHTPVDAKMPGVFFHMAMVKMLLDGKFYKDVDKSLLISWLILLLGTLLIILIQLFKQPVWDIIAILIITIGTYLLDTYKLLPEGYEISLFFSLFAVVGTYSWKTLLNFYLANQDKAFLKNAFGNYISPELIDEMYETGNAPKLGGDCGPRTAYFTDIQSFSTFSEKLSATQLVELLNEYLTVMTDILLEHKGTLDKYEGDAIIAFFGAPLPLPDHATKACEVAIRMQMALLKLRKKWTSEGDKWPKIVHEMRMRIGINSGEIVTGNMGSTQRMNYTMMGDSVNLAARLEEAAKQYGIFTQISSMTKDLLEDKFDMRELDTVKVVGKSEPVTTFELIGLKNQTTTEIELKLIELFHTALGLYKQQKWDEAKSYFEQSLKLEHERFPLLKEKKNPSAIYIERCEEFKENPPGDDWDGIYTLTSK